MASNYGLSPSEIDAVHAVNPELAAHTIAFAYISSSANVEKLSNGEDVILNDVLSLSNQYVQAYNYAYNFVTHENRLINEAE